MIETDLILSDNEIKELIFLQKGKMNSPEPHMTSGFSINYDCGSNCSGGCKGSCEDLLLNMRIGLRL